LLLLPVCLYAGALYAQDRIYTLGTTLDLAGGGTNQVTGLAAAQPQSSSFFPFYGAYPSLTLKAAGAHTVLNADYAYGYNRFQSDPKYTDQSHSGALNFNWTLSPELKISLSDSFRSTSDYATFNAIRGIASDAGPPSPIVFFPVASNVISRVNTAFILTNYKLDDRSSLSFNASHSLSDYSGTQNAAAAAALPNQQRFSGDFSYQYQTGKYESWSLGYTAAYFDVAQHEAASSPYQNAYSQTIHLTYSNQLMPGLNVALGAGVSKVDSQGSAGGYTGYNSLANLRRTVGKTSSLSLHFTQNSGDTSGLGTISSTRSGGLSYSYATKVVTFFADASLFDTKGTLDNTYRARGGSATANVGFPLSKSWSVQTGAQYQRYTGLSSFNFTQKRVFLTLRYTNLAFWKAAR
jgi:hypothetical protein